VRLITIRVDATGVLRALVRARLPAGREPVRIGQTPAHIAAGMQPASLYDRAGMGAGDRCDGPAIVTQLDATTLAPPGWSGTMHESGVLVLQRRSQPGGG
jgi:N-methylhydantoinase A